jgi:uncharacterized RDD family membrane protein YckC
VYCGVCGRELNGVACDTCDSAPTDLRSRTGLRLAPWQRRVGATLVDWLVLYLVLLITTTAADYFISVVIFAAVCAYYLVHFVSNPRGQTLGCIAAGTQIRSARDGGHVTLMQSAVRFVGSAAPLLITMIVIVPFLQIVLWAYLVVDWLFPLWDRQRQTLHDKWAGTVVVYMAPSVAIQPTGTE